MPDSSSGLSNVKRFSPVTGSVPTVEIIRPSTPAISPLTSDSRDERGDHAQAEHAEREVRLRRERERHGRQPLGEQHQHDEAEQAADEPRIERDAERLAGPPLQLHRVAVDDRGRRRVGAGRADQDGGDRTAVLGADIRRREHHDRHRRIQP